VLLSILAVPAIVAAVLWMPGVLLAAYLLIPTYKAAVQPWIPIDITLGLAILNAVQVFALLLYRDIGLTRRGLIVWMAIAALITAGALYAPNQSLALELVGQWWFLVVAPLTAAARVAMKRTYLIQFLGVIVVLSSVAIGLALTQTLALASEERLQVLGDNTIQSARAVLLFPLIGAAYFLRTRGRAGWLALPLLPIGVYGALATGSRGPLLAFVATIVLLGVSMATRRPASRRMAVVSVVAVLTMGALVVAVDLLPSVSLERIGLLFESIGGGTAAGGSINTRATLFGLAVSAFEGQPVLGVGTGGFASIARETITLSGYEYPHNTLLQIAAELGIVGAALALYMVVLAFLAPTPPTVTWFAVRGLAAFYVLNALVSGGLYEERMLWGLLLVLLCAPASEGGSHRLAPRG
jgi:O-antigen ligase